MSGLAVLILVILCLLLAPMVLPIRFRGQVQVKESFSGYGEVSGFGGWVKLYVSKESGARTHQYVRLFNWEKSIGAGKPKTATKKRKPRASRGKAVITRDLMSAVYRYLIKLARCLNLEARLEGEYGTGDPALTGFLCAVIAALAGEQSRIRLNPNFMEASLDMEGEIKGRFSAVVVLWHTVVLLLSSPVRSLWWPKFSIKKYGVREVV